MSRSTTPSSFYAPVSYGDVLGAVNRSRKTSKNSSGFTILELLVVVTVLGILAGIAIPFYNGYIEKARVTRAIAEVKDISTTLAAYVAGHQVLPSNLTDAGYQNFLDPWGNPYQYFELESQPPGQGRKDNGKDINTDYDLFSMGRDGKWKKPLQHKYSADDIIRADNGSYIGPASGY